MLSICLMLFCFKKCENSLEVNWGPLSDTSCSGNPWQANTDLKALMVFSDVVQVMITTFGHLECVSIATKICDQGRVLRSPHGFSPMVHLDIPRNVKVPHLDWTGWPGRLGKIFTRFQSLCQALPTRNGCGQLLSSVRFLDDWHEDT